MATVNTSGAVHRITKEIAHIQNGNDVSLTVAYREDDLRRVRALIIGPPDTPYEFGFFEFDIKFPRDYPITYPHVQCITTNGGKTRFNPNIYADGKVCLSILGTWEGEPGEQWSGVQGLESVLLSIQSLMNSNPYENEPGYEGTDETELEPTLYINKIRHETLRISVIIRLEILLNLSSKPEVFSMSRPRPSLGQVSSSNISNGPQNPFFILNNSECPSGASTPATPSPPVKEPKLEQTFSDVPAFSWSQWSPFADLIKRRFLWQFDSYMQTITQHIGDQKQGEQFPEMPFELPGNTMTGVYHYENLKHRLDKILLALNAETTSWEKKGAEMVKNKAQLAVKLAFQFEQLVYRWNKSEYSGSRMEIALPDPNNPFVWKIVIFGQQSGTLEGGIFNAQISIPPNFPDDQPRVVVETPIFHRLVSSVGSLCYFPRKPDEIESHLEAIIAAIDDENPVYDPRLVINPEAYELFWNSRDDRKQYRRKQRRSAHESSEY